MNKLDRVLTRLLIFGVLIITDTFPESGQPSRPWALMSPSKGAVSTFAILYRGEERVPMSTVQVNLSPCGNA